jgi:Uma2 family endonuclease
LRIFEDRRGYRLAYDRGELEIMSPTSFGHDKDSNFLGFFIVALTDELALPLLPGGSVTLRRRAKQRGIESDHCFWIANASQVAGVGDLDLRIHPPPDLAVEVDVTSSSLNRLGIYAALKVPEVWRLEGNQLTFLILGSDGKYATATHSMAFPLVTPADLMTFVQQARQADNVNVVLHQFRAWIQQRLANP